MHWVCSPPQRGHRNSKSFTSNSARHLSHRCLRRQTSIASSSDSRFVSRTSASKQKRSASASTAASSPMRTPTFWGWAPGCRPASVCTASRIELAIPISCMTYEPCKCCDPPDSLANARQLVASQHIHYARSSQRRTHSHQARVLFGDLADDSRFPPKRMSSDRHEYVVGNPGLDDGDQLTFVGNVQRIAPQYFPCPANFVSNGNRALFQFDSDSRLSGDLIQCARQPAARGITHTADRLRDFKHFSDQHMQSSAVALNCRFKFQAFTLRQYGNPVFANRSAEQDFISWASAI